MTVPHAVAQGVSPARAARDTGCALAEVLNEFGTGFGWTTTAEELRVPLDEHITNVISFMRERAEALGLKGTL